MSSTPEGGDSLNHGPGVRSVATLSRDLADFLVEFSIVLHKRAMYPVGHPHLQESTARFVGRLESLLAARDSLAIGVARHQLIVAGTATDPRNALLSDLARRLHRHRIATVRFDRDVSLSEIDDLLVSLASDPQGEDGPFGLRPGAGSSWTRLRIQPPELSRMFLQDDEPDARAETPADALWLGLANLALSSDGEGTEAAEDPLLVARAIDAQPEQTAYDRVVLDYLGQIADEMSGRQGAWEPRIRERVSRLVTSLKPETLRRVLEAGADNAERRHFALTSAEVFAADAVIEVVEAAAATTGQTISHQLLRLLNKFARYAETGPEENRAEAESTLRRNVAHLISGWNLEDPNPGAYTAVLDGMVRQAPGAPAAADEEQLGCEPELVLQLALEANCGGPRVDAALESLIERRRVSALVELLRSAPAHAKSTADALWGHLATPARLRTQLAEERPDFLAAEGLVARLGRSATEPLLDLLERASTSSVRGRTLRLLVSLGPSVAPAAAARLKDAPWYVQRNLLVLIRMLRTWPPDFSAVSYARHADPRLRREAYKLLLEFPQHRASAILHGLEDTSPDVVTLVLRAAVEDCPREALRTVERITEDWRRPGEQRALAVRALARGSGPQALGRLVHLSGARRSFLGWTLDARSPVALAAVSALARHFAAHPQIAGLLQAARNHTDPEIRLAARMRSA
ncbi:MAG TPA: hypothetical protein VFN08_06380 [Gemmatimonadales bacterium]|nr:hypothetical protein [Gemmatimonadales bacterium]